MTNNLLRAGALSCALLATTCLTPAPGLAQIDDSTTPPRQVIDANGVDVASGQFRTASEGVAIAGLNFGLGWTGAVDHDSLDIKVVLGGTNERHVFIGGQTRVYSNSGGTSFNPQNADGSLLVETSTGNYTLTLADGTQYLFKPSAIVQGGFSIPISIVDKIVQPDGRTMTFHYRTATFQQCGIPGGPPTPPCRNNARTRVQSVTDNRGYMLKPVYASQSAFDSGDNMEDIGFGRIVSVSAIDLSTDYCSPTADTCTGLTQSWPTLQLTETPGSGGTTIETVTDPGGNETDVTRDADERVTGVDEPAASGNDTAITYDSSGRVATVTEDGLTWTYSYSETSTTLTTTAALSGGGSRVTVVDKASGRLLSETDELSRTTSYQYDGSGRRTRITFPEGNYTQFAYDTRGNVIEVRQVAKSGSGLADIVTSAAFPSGCSNNLTCNQPESTTDARGNTTDYTYDSTHGGVTRVQLPAPASVQPRPEINYSYAAHYGRIKAPNGQFVTQTQPVYLVTEIRQCATAAICSGSANETVVTIGYDQNNLLPVTVTTTAGNGSVSSTVTTAYDELDRVKTVDGPLSGSADTTRYYYDSAGRLRGLIGPDPDGTGSLLHRAVRYSYDAEDRVTKVERGTATSQSDSAIESITVLETADSVYDGNGRRIRDSLIAASTTHALTQYSYDSLGRLQCTAVRMNPNEFAPSSLPSDACTLDTQGSFGADRIIRNTYDNAGQLTLVQTGYGVSGVQADEAAFAYTSNGQVQHVTDAEGNRTTYEYDGHDRLSKTRFPSPTTDGVNSTTDYEQLAYDAASNVTSRRLRDGRSIGYSYDALGRLAFQDTPTGGYWDWDKTFAYDNLGRLLSITDGWGNVDSWGYDALGRNVSETSSAFGTKSMQYDLAGRLTRLTWPDSFYVDYVYNAAGEMTEIRENGSTASTCTSTSACVLASFAYDNLGRRTSVTRGNGTVTSYSYDAVSRLSQLVQNLSGTSYDLTLGFSYNPAGQIVSNTRSNDHFAFGGHANLNRTDTVNGLNQVTQTGSAGVSYDTNGNLYEITGTSGPGGSDRYWYTSENRLATVLNTNGGYYLPYWPSGRLAELYHGTLGSQVMFDYVGALLVTEYTPSQTIARRYVHGPGIDEPLVWYEGSGTSTRRWFHADERGSIVAVSDAAGNLADTGRYDEYGVPHGTAGRFAYTGQPWLPEIGLYYYRNRMYNPALGRFMQPDPIGFGGGMNWYAYVLNDPVNFTDPLGLQGEPNSDADGDGQPDPDIPITGTRPGNHGGVSASARLADLFLTARLAAREDVLASCAAPSGSRFDDSIEAILAAARRLRAQQRGVGNQSPDNDERSFHVTPRRGGGLSWYRGSVGSPDNVDIIAYRNSVAAGHLHTIGGGNALSRSLDRLDVGRDVEQMESLLSQVNNPSEFVTVLVGEDGKVRIWVGRNLDAEPTIIETDQCPS